MSRPRRLWWWPLLPCLIAACGRSEPSNAPVLQPSAHIEVLATGAGIAGVNGLAFSPDGLLYVASVLGSELVVLDPRSGEVRRRLGEVAGVEGPADVAFAPDGSVYWTSSRSGQVVGFSLGGARVVAANLSAGVDPLTFAPDGRLFVAQCFYGDGLYEVGPRGGVPPRPIEANLGPGCALKGMDWGPDGRLYGARWFHGDVVSIDVETGDRRTVAGGFGVPAAVKFDHRGRLHVLDTGRGQVVRVSDSGRRAVAASTRGLDGLAFGPRDRLFVSSSVDGSVSRLEDDGTFTELSPGGMISPGGVTVYQPHGGTPQVMVADLHALRGFDPDSGEVRYVHRDLVGVGEMGTVTAVSADGDNLIITAFSDDDVRIWSPAEGQVVTRFKHLRQPVSAIRYRDMVAVTESGTGRVLGLVGDSMVPLAEQLPAPTDLATDGTRLFVSDRQLGEILEIANAGASIPPRVVVSGLEAPEGLAWSDDGLVVVEGESGRVLAVGDDGATRLLAVVAPGMAPGSDAAPPSRVLNDVAALGNHLFVTGETGRVLYRLDLTTVPPSDSVVAAAQRTRVQ